MHAMAIESNVLLRKACKIIPAVVVLPLFPKLLRVSGVRAALLYHLFPAGREAGYCAAEHLNRYACRCY